MAVDSEQVEAVAREVVSAMQRDHGSDQELTATITVATTRRPNGEVYIRCMAVDGEGTPLPPWHLKGILRYLIDELPG